MNTPKMTDTSSKAPAKSKASAKPEPWPEYVTIIDDREHDFMWIQNDVVRYKFRVVGTEAFAVYAMCCYFMGCPDRYSPKRMSELSGMSERRCEEEMKTLIGAGQSKRKRDQNERD